MKYFSKPLILVLSLLILVACGTNRSTSSKGKKKEIDTRQQYLTVKSDAIFESYRKENAGQVNDFTIAYILSLKP